jgi:alpha-galactosidase
MYRVRPVSAPATLAPLVVTGTSGAAAAWLQAGQSTTVQATVTNYGVDAATGLRANLAGAPAGWQIQPSSANPPPGTSLAAGRSASYGWTVAAPATLSDPITTAQLTLATSYTWGGTSGGSSACQPARCVNTSVAVPVNAYSPVQAPQATYSSATETPSYFGQVGQRFAIDSDGADVWVGADEYGAIYGKGNAGTTATVQTELTAQQNMGGFAKAGIMVRNDMTGAGTSPEGVILFASPAGGIQLEWNDNGGTYIDNVTPPNGTTPETLPVWLRLVRSGSSYTGYYSTDGATWQLVGSATVPGQAATQDAGMFITSHSAGSPGLVYFNGFSVS